MLWRTPKLLGAKVEAADGLLGTVRDLLFQQADWTMRWAVVDTGRWLPGRKVMLPTSVLGPFTKKAFRIGVTRDQVERGPYPAADAPVSRRTELEIYEHYSWIPYWAEPMEGELAERPVMAEIGMIEVQDDDRILRSTRDVTGYKVEATDGGIGHVEAFLVDDTAWVIRYLVIDTKDWLPAKKVLVSIGWIDRIDWGEESAHVELTRAEIEGSPAYDPDMPVVDRAYEEELHRHYGQTPYWY